MDSAINIGLLLIVFGLARWKTRPYAGALVLGLIKGALYVVVSFGKAPVWQ